MEYNLKKSLLTIKLFTMKKLSLLAFSLLGIMSFTNAQFGHWRLGGNPGAPPPIPDAVNATNNSFGTLNNLPINIVTNGTVRMVINNGATGINDGK